MPVTRLNHAVLYVRDVATSVAFYEQALDFDVVMRLGENAAFLQAPASTNDHDLGLFAVGAQASGSAAGRGSVGLYHLAWEVDTLDELARLRDRLSELGALVGASDHGTTKSLYGKDPDGLEFEIAWIVPADLLAADLTIGTAALDLPATIARFGGSTVGGVGVSFAAPST